MDLLITTEVSSPSLSALPWSEATRNGIRRVLLGVLLMICQSGTILAKPRNRVMLAVCCRNQHLLQNGFDGKLHVRLFDHDKKLLRKDTVEPMGGTEIDLAELKTAGKKSHSLRIPLKGFFRNYMTVNFTTEYFSIHGEPRLLSIVPCPYFFIVLCQRCYTRE